MSQKPSHDLVAIAWD